MSLSCYILTKTWMFSLKYANKVCLILGGSHDPIMWPPAARDLKISTLKFAKSGTFSKYIMGETDNKRTSLATFCMFSLKSVTGKIGFIYMTTSHDYYVSRGVTRAWMISLCQLQHWNSQILALLWNIYRVKQIIKNSSCYILTKICLFSLKSVTEKTCSI